MFPPVNEESPEPPPPTKRTTRSRGGVSKKLKY